MRCGASSQARVADDRSHLNGHVDVVPVEAAERWTHDPWGAEIDGGRMWGRGRGRHEGGHRGLPRRSSRRCWRSRAPLRGDLLFTSVIEEESGGNGMWSVRAGRLHSRRNADRRADRPARASQRRRCDLGAPDGAQRRRARGGRERARAAASTRSCGCAGPASAGGDAQRGPRGAPVQPQPRRDPRRRRGRRRFLRRSSFAAGSASVPSSSRRMRRLSSPGRRELGARGRGRVRGLPLQGLRALAGRSARRAAAGLPHGGRTVSAEPPGRKLSTATTDARYVDGHVLLLRPGGREPARDRRVGRSRLDPRHRAHGGAGSLALVCVSMRLGLRGADWGRGGRGGVPHFSGAGVKRPRLGTPSAHSRHGPRATRAPGPVTLEAGGGAGWPHGIPWG